jgi:hypothetical protein
LGIGIAFFDIVGVVCGNGRNSRFAAKSQKALQSDPFLCNAVILYFQIEVFLAKQVLVKECRFFGFFLAIFYQQGRNFTRNAPGKSDQPLVIGFKKGIVHSRSCIKAFRIAL